MKITYGNICKKLEEYEDRFCRIKDDDYLGILGAAEDFYEIRKLPANTGTNYGWKFHIGLECRNESDDSFYYKSENLEKGFDIAYGILVKHGVALFKVMTPGTASLVSFSPEEIQASQINKQITIYAAANPEKTVQDWQEMFTEITKAYQENNIKSFSEQCLLDALKNYYQINGQELSQYEIENKICRSEKRVLGSDFISYRYDLDKDSKYIPGDQAQDYRSGSECEDPYLGIDLSKKELLISQIY